MAAYTDKIDRVFEFCAQLGFTERVNYHDPWNADPTVGRSNEPPCEHEWSVDEQDTRRCIGCGEAA